MWNGFVRKFERKKRKEMQSMEVILHTVESQGSGARPRPPGHQVGGFSLYCSVELILSPLLLNRK